MTKSPITWVTIPLVGCLTFSLSSCTTTENIELPDPNRFVVTTLGTGFYEPMELSILPDGDVLLIERPGRIKKYDSKKNKIKTIGTIEVLYEEENGLLGLALDPEFNENHWVYLFYTVPGEASKQHVSRFTLEGDSLMLSSEKVLLEIPIEKEFCCHMGGCLEFDQDGNLYISTGDNSNPTPFGSTDERPGRRQGDSQRTSANTLDLRGKILRIRPQANGTYTIPAGNLFAQGDSLSRPEIYTMGNRNPFRMSIDPLTGILFWGDLGPNPSVGKDSSRGPNSHEEINQARQAGNYGWPYLLANNQPYRDFDYGNNELGSLFNSDSLINDSPNNTGLKRLPKAQGAFLWYPNTPSDMFPEVGSGGGSVMAGPVYRYDKYPDSGVKFPSYYDGNLFIFDWMRNWIITVSMDREGNLKGLQPFLSEATFSRPIDMEFGPDGALYVLEYGSHWYIQNRNSRLVRITYANESPLPIAHVQPDNEKNLSPNHFPELIIRFEGNRTFYHPNDTYDYVVQARDKVTGANVDIGDPSDVQVKLYHMPHYRNVQMATKIHPPAGFVKGKALIDASDCKACHLDEGFSIGPNFSRISNLYRDQPASFQFLSQKIISGGTGKWGEFNMPAHPQLDLLEAHQMVRYILSLASELSGEQGLPLAGSFETRVNQGLYLLSASYVIREGDVAPEAHTNLILRHPNVPAGSYDASQGVISGLPQDGFNLVAKVEETGAFILFSDVDLTGISSLIFKFRSTENQFRIEARLDSTNGQIMGLVDSVVRGKEDSQFQKSSAYLIKYMAIDEVEGQHDLYLIFDLGAQSLHPTDSGVQLESIYFQAIGKDLPVNSF